MPSNSFVKDIVTERHRKKSFKYGISTDFICKLTGGGGAKRIQVFVNYIWQLVFSTFNQMKIPEQQI